MVYYWTQHCPLENTLTASLHKHMEPSVTAKVTNTPSLSHSKDFLQITGVASSGVLPPHAVWDPASKQLSDQVERVQNRAMRTILGKPSGTRSLHLRSLLGWRTLSDRRKLRRAITTYKIHCPKIPPLHPHPQHQHKRAS